MIRRRRKDSPQAASSPAQSLPKGGEVKRPSRTLRRTKPAESPASEPAEAKAPKVEQALEAPAPEAAPVQAAAEPAPQAPAQPVEAAKPEPAPVVESAPPVESKPAQVAAPEAKAPEAAAKPEPTAVKAEPKAAEPKTSAPEAAAPKAEPAPEPKVEAAKPAAEPEPAPKAAAPETSRRSDRRSGAEARPARPKLPGLGSAVVRPPSGFDAQNHRQRVERDRAHGVTTRGQVGGGAGGRAGGPPERWADGRPAGGPGDAADAGRRPDRGRPDAPGGAGDDRGRGRGRGRGRKGRTEINMERVRNSRRNRKRKNSSAPKMASPQPKAQKRKVQVDNTISVKQLAHEMGEKAGSIIKTLMGLDLMATINDQLDFETASMVAEEFDYECVNVGFQEESHMIEVSSDVDEENAVLRPPVITVMGHVDHGKTTLLDTIRKADVAGGEAGGITQHIGAYQVTKNGQKITFIDTPGHSAFTEMRARGAQATDIVILVVAADDGIMPQTVESINHTKAADVPIVVAINKCDKEGANPDAVKQRLMEHGLVPEEYGGEVQMLPVSGLTGEGVPELLEAVLLQAEVMELKANPERHAEGVVLEARLEKGRGAVATILVQQGTLHPKEPLVLGTVAGRVRALTDHNGKKLKLAGPSTPVEIIGLKDVPAAGDLFTVVKSDKAAKSLAEHRAEAERAAALSANKRMTLQDLFKRKEEGELKKLNLIVRGDVQGSLEALKSSIKDVEVDGTDINILQAAVGAISESDITLASTYDAIVVGFNVRPDPKARRAAEEKQVEVRHYRVIYELLDDLKAALVGMLDPVFEEKVTGHAEVRETFSIPKVGTVAGCYVVDGTIGRNHKGRLTRQGVVVWEGKLSSLKRFKDDAKEVGTGYECGLGLENFNDIKVGDELETYIMEEVAHQL
ncbi:MAG: translation initiation factor IF-2 [Myxococcota bacterium]|nr:translation initiation factor IF-2 [Myxococcota bacterium]